MDLGSWQKKLSGFGSGFSPLSSRKAETAGQTIEEPTELLASLPDIGTLKMEWHLFLDSVSRADHSVLSVHLGSCEPVLCTDRGVLTISCCRKFSYEELLPELPALQKSVAAFYRLPLTLRLVYDAEKDACTKEKTVFTLFEELSRKNPVVQFIIREFGGELIY
ncbi:MAG: DNA polymerase III subunit gamma/tau [Chlorobi bacterium]|nr:DNA polymerase III subunit gamma/tau [Chlorobiota bacterium]